MCIKEFSSTLKMAAMKKEETYLLTLRPAKKLISLYEVQKYITDREIIDCLMLEKTFKGQLVQAPCNE